MHKTLRLPLLLLAAALLAACSPEDRSGEQPFAPTVTTGGVEIEPPRAILSGVVTASPNSTLRKCGFKCGNDTLRFECVAETPADTFSAATDTLLSGRYFAVAYAQNGVGTSYGDTIYFQMP